MNGTIQFESELNKGTTFSISIPLQHYIWKQY
jgi:signal transduction histidine kinase